MYYYDEDWLEQEKMFFEMEKVRGDLARLVKLKIEIALLEDLAKQLPLDSLNSIMEEKKSLAEQLSYAEKAAIHELDYPTAMEVLN